MKNQEEFLLQQRLSNEGKLHKKTSFHFSENLCWEKEGTEVGLKNYYNEKIFIGFIQFINHPEYLEPTNPNYLNNRKKLKNLL